MIKIGDVVFVQNKGICKVENIAKNAFVGADKTKEYFVFKPVDVSNNMMVYFPTDTKATMRKLSSKTQVKSLIDDFGELEEIKIASEDERFSKYAEITQKGNLEDWCRLLKTLAVRKSKIQKKQFNIQEQKYINTLLSCVLAEMSYVNGEDKDAIKDKLSQNLDIAL